MAAPIRRGPILSPILCGGLLVAAIMLGTMMMAGEFRERALGNHERELENTVLLLTRYFDQQFEDTEIIANDVTRRMQFTEIDSPETFRIWMSSYDAHQILKSKVSVLSYIGDVGIFDADGKLIKLNPDLAAAVLRHLGANLFQELEVGRQSENGGRRTGSPPHHRQLDHRHRPPDKWPERDFSRIRRQDDFIPSITKDIFASVALGSGSAILTFHHDGTMLGRYPHVDFMVGEKFEYGAAAEQGADRRWPPDPAGTK